MRTHPNDWTRCPYCLELHDAATGGDDAPENGDVAVCFVCASVTFYDETSAGGRRRPTAEENVRLRDDHRVRELVEKVIELRKHHTQ